MANEKIISQSVFEEAIKDILTELVNSTYSWESYSDEEIGSLVELDPTQVAELSAVISDTQVAKNKVFSSFHTKELLQENIIEANKYTDDLVANLSNIKLDIVDSLPDSSTVNKSTIYILKDSSGGTNNTLNVWSDTTSAFVEVGKLNVNMDNYYTKSEVDAELDKKANADEVLKPDAIVADLTTTSGSTTLSTAGLQTELDKKANDDEVLKTTDVVTSISKTSTDNTVPTSKAVETRMSKREIIKNVDLNTFVDEGKYYIASGCTNSPIDGGYLNIMRYNDDFVCQICARYYISTSNNMYIRTKVSGTWREWQSVCTTSVPDVPQTPITFSDNTNYEAKATSIYSNYEVADGICHVLIYVKCLVPTNSWISINDSLPRPKRFVFKSLSALDNATDSLNCTINMGGNMSLRGGTANGEYITTFSYHVAG